MDFYQQYQKRGRPAPTGIGGALQTSVQQLSNVGVGITTRIQKPSKSDSLTRLPKIFQRKSKTVGKVSTAIGKGQPPPPTPAPQRPLEQFERKARQVANQPFIRAVGPPPLHPLPGESSRRVTKAPQRATPDIFVNDQPVEIFRKTGQAIGTTSRMFPPSGRQSPQNKNVPDIHGPPQRFKKKAKAVGAVSASLGSGLRGGPQKFPPAINPTSAAGKDLFRAKAQDMGKVQNPWGINLNPVVKAVEKPVEDSKSRLKRKMRSIGFLASQPLFKIIHAAPDESEEGEGRDTVSPQPLTDADRVKGKFRRKAMGLGMLAARKMFQRALVEEIKDEAAAGGVPAEKKTRFRKVARAILRTQKMCKFMAMLRGIGDPTRGSNEEEIKSGKHPLLKKEILLNLFPYLGLEDLKTARLVCEFWKRFATLSLQQKSTVNLSGICPYCNSEFIDYSIEPQHEHIDSIPFYSFCKFINDIPSDRHYHLPFRNYKISNLNLYFNVHVTTDATGVFLLFLKFLGDKVFQLHLENVELCPPDSVYRILDVCVRLRSIVFDNCQVWIDPLAPDEDQKKPFKMNLNHNLTSITFLTNFICEELLHWQMIFQAFPKLQELNLVDVTKVEINHCLAALLNLPDEEETVEIKKVGGFKKLSRKIMLLPLRPKEGELGQDGETKSFQQVTRFLVNMPFNMARLKKLEMMVQKKPEPKFKHRIAQMLEQQPMALATKPKLVKLPKTKFEAAISAMSPNFPMMPFRIPMRTIEPESEMTEPGGSEVGAAGSLDGSIAAQSPAPPAVDLIEATDYNMGYFQVSTSKFKKAGVQAFQAFKMYDKTADKAPKEVVQDQKVPETIQEEALPVTEEAEQAPKKEMSLGEVFYGLKVKSRLKDKRKKLKEAEASELPKVTEEGETTAAEAPPGEERKKEEPQSREVAAVAQKYFAMKLKHKFVQRKQAADEDTPTDGQATPTIVPPADPDKLPPESQVLVLTKSDVKSRLRARLAAMARGEIPVPTMLHADDPAIVQRVDSPDPDQRSDADESPMYTPRRDMRSLAKAAAAMPFGLDAQAPMRAEWEEREREKKRRRQERAESKMRVKSRMRHIINSPFTIVQPRTEVNVEPPEEVFKPKTFRAEIKKLMFQPFRLIKAQPKAVDKFKRLAKNLADQPFNLTGIKQPLPFVLPGSCLRKISIGTRRNFEDQLRIEYEAYLQAQEDPLDPPEEDDQSDEEEDTQSLVSLSGSVSTNSSEEPSSMRERDFAALEMTELLAEVLTRFEITHLNLRVNYTKEDADNFPIVLEACNPKVIALTLTRPSKVFVPEMDLHIRYNPFETIEETVMVLPNIKNLSIAHNVVDTMDQITMTFPNLVSLEIHVVNTEVCARKIVPYKTYIKTDLMITMRSAKPHLNVKSLMWNVQESRNAESGRRTVVYKSNALLYAPTVFPHLSKLVVSITSAEELHAIFRGCLALHDLVVLKNSFYRTKDYDIIGEQESEFVQFRVVGEEEGDEAEPFVDPFRVRHDGIKQLKFLRRLSLENNNCLLSNQAIQYGFINLRRLRSIHISRTKKITKKALKELKICRFLIHISVTKEKTGTGKRRVIILNRDEPDSDSELKTSAKSRRRRRGPPISFMQPYAPPEKPRENFESSNKYEHFGGKRFALVTTTYQVNGRRYQLTRREYECEGDRDNKIWESRYKLATLRERERREKELEEAAGQELDIDPQVIIEDAERQYEEDLLNAESEYERMIHDYDEEGEIDAYCDEDVELDFEEQEEELMALQDESSGEDGLCAEADTMYEGDREYYLDTEDKSTTEESYCDTERSTNFEADPESGNDESPPTDPPEGPDGPGGPSRRDSRNDDNNSESQSPRKRRKSIKTPKSDKSQRVYTEGPQPGTPDFQAMAVAKLTYLYKIGQGQEHAIEFNPQALEGESDLRTLLRPGTSTPGPSRTTPVKPLSSSPKPSRNKRRKKSEVPKTPDRAPRGTKTPEDLIEEQLVKLKKKMKKKDKKGKMKDMDHSTPKKKQKKKEKAPRPPKGPSNVGHNLGPTLRPLHDHGPKNTVPEENFWDPTIFPIGTSPLLDPQGPGISSDPVNPDGSRHELIQQMAKQVKHKKKKHRHAY